MFLQNNVQYLFNPLNAELNPICHLLALLGAHHILHVSRIRVNYREDHHTKILIKVSLFFLTKITSFALFHTILTPHTRHN